MSAVETAPRAEVPSPAEAPQRLTQLLGSTLELFTFYLGDRLGLYHELAATALAPPELAARTGTHERYIREWLEQQTVAGILTVTNPEDPPMERSYMLPPGHAEALADRDSPFYVGSVAQATVSVVRPIDAVLDAFRTGAGVPFEVYGPDCVEGMVWMNRLEAFIYAASVLHCLPVGMAEQPSVATGMAMRPGTLRSYAQEAGLRDIERLPIDDPTGLAFYRLVS